MVPMIETPEDATKLVRACKYPPLGGRSFGPYRAKYLIDGDYLRRCQRLDDCVRSN